MAEPLEPTPDDPESVGAFFRARDRERRVGPGAEASGFGSGIADALKQAGLGFLDMLREAAPGSIPGVRATQDYAERYAERAVAREERPPTVVRGRPESIEDVYPKPPGVVGALGELGASFFPPAQVVSGVKRFLRGDDPRYLAQSVQGPMQEGQSRPVQVQPLGRPEPYERGFERGAGTGEAMVGTALSAMMADPLLRRVTRPQGRYYEATPVGQPQRWWENPELPATGTPDPLPPERGLPPPPGETPRGLPGYTEEPGAPGFGEPPPQTGPPGAGGRAAGSSYQFTVRMPNGVWAEFAVDAKTELEAVQRARASMTPEMRDFFDRMQPEILYRGKATGQEGIYGFKSNDPRYKNAEQQKAQAAEEWSAWEERRRRSARTGRGSPGPPPRSPRPAPEPEAPGATNGRPPDEGAGQTADRQPPPKPGPTPKAAKGAPKSQQRPAAAGGAAESPKASRAKPGPQAPPKQPEPEAAAPDAETPLQREYRERLEKARKEFEDAHGYAAPDYAAPSDLDAMTKAERAKKEGGKAGGSPPSREATGPPPPQDKGEIRGKNEGKISREGPGTPSPSEAGRPEQPEAGTSSSGAKAPRPSAPVEKPAQPAESDLVGRAVNLKNGHRAVIEKVDGNWYVVRRNALSGKGEETARVHRKTVTFAAATPPPTSASKKAPRGSKATAAAPPQRKETAEQRGEPARADEEKFTVEVPGLGVKMKTGAGEVSPKGQAARDEATRRLAKQTATPPGKGAVTKAKAKAALDRGAVYHGMDSKPLNDWYERLFGKSYKKDKVTYSDAHDRIRKELHRIAGREPYVDKESLLKREEPGAIEKIMRETEAARKAKAGPAPAAEQTEAAEAPPSRTEVDRTGAVGRSGTVRTPNRNYDITYEEVPLADITPSHDPMTFRRSKGYPFEQQRDYEASKGEQLKVESMAREFDPDFILSDDPTATSGPPIVSQEGNILGGNGRTMALKRRLSEDPAFVARWQASIEAARSKFGLPEGAPDTKGPTVIIRRVAKDMTPDAQAASTKDFNEDQKKEVDPTDQAIARAKNLSQESIDFIAESLTASDSTIRDLLQNNPTFYRELMRRLSDERITHSGELPRFLDDRTGKLNEQGMRMVEDTILGRVVRSSKLLRTMAPQTRQTFMNALTDLAKAEAMTPDWNIRPALIDGLAIYEQSLRENKSVEMVMQPRLEPDPFLDAVKENVLAQELAAFLEENQGKPNALRTALRKYEAAYQDAVGDQQTISFVTKYPAHEAFNKAFDTKLSAEDFATGGEGVYLYDITSLVGKGLRALGDKLSEKGKDFADWLFTPSDVRLRRNLDTVEEIADQTAFPRTGDSFRRALRGVFERFMNVTILDRPLSKFPAFREELARYNVRRTNAAIEAVDAFGKALAPIRFVDEVSRKKRKVKEVDEMFIDLWKDLQLRDAWARAKVGVVVPPFAERQYRGRTREFMVTDLERRAKEVEQYAHPDMLEARERLYDMMTALRKEQVERGKLTEADRFGRYYWPHIFEFGKYADELHLTPATPSRIKEAVRRYTRKAKGTIRQHDPNFLISGIHHYLQVKIDNLLDDFAHEVGRTWDTAPKVIEHAEKLSEIRIPHTHTVYHVRRSKYGWNAETYAEFKTLMEIQRDPDLGEPIYTYEDVRALHAIHTGRERLVYVIPKEIASKLESFRLPRSAWDQFAGDIRGMIGRWKGWILSMLGSRYQLENLLGDWTNVMKLPGLDRVGVVPIPSGAKAFGQLPQAVVDAIQMAYGDVREQQPFQRHGPIAKFFLEKTAGSETSPTARGAYDLGISQQTYASAELADLRKHPTLDVFTKPKRGVIGKVAVTPFELIDKALDVQRMVTLARESVPRQMTWLYLLSKGFSPERAATVTNRELIDYQNVPDMVRVFRDTGITPFLSFYWQNFPNWIRAFTGSALGAKSELAPELGGQGGAIRPPQAPPEGEPGGGWFGEPGFVPPELTTLKSRGEVPRMGLRNFFLVFGVPMVALWAWNEANEDPSNPVDPWTKLNMTYMHIGRLQDGRPVYVAFNSPIDAVLSIAGATNPIERGQRIVEGFEKGEGGKAVARQAYETAIGPASTLGGLLGPAAAYGRMATETSQERYRELWEADPEIDRKLDSWFDTFSREQTPYVRQWRGITREDLDELPSWAPLFLSPSPLSLLIKIPETQAERDRRKKPSSRGTTISTKGGGQMKGAITP